MPRRGRPQILVACGASIATTAMVVEILTEDLARQKKYKVDFHKCKTSELMAKAEIMEEFVSSRYPLQQAVQALETFGSRAGLKYGVVPLAFWKA